MDRLTDEVNKIQDSLERKAVEKLNEANAYHKGYMQAVCDFGRETRLAILEMKVESED